MKCQFYGTFEVEPLVG